MHFAIALSLVHFIVLAWILNPCFRTKSGRSFLSSSCSPSLTLPIRSVPHIFSDAFRFFVCVCCLVDCCCCHIVIHSLTDSVSSHSLSLPLKFSSARFSRTKLDELRTSFETMAIIKCNATQQYIQFNRKKRTGTRIVKE